MSLILEEEKRAQKIAKDLSKLHLPLRMVHNDAKADNLLYFEDALEEPLVIDFDTCAPGYLWQDLGDMIRSMCFAMDYQEKKTGNWYHVKLQSTWLGALMDGYWKTVSFQVTEDELRSISLGGQDIVLELAVRYLDDYLTGDTYFRCKGEKESLKRAQKQFAIYQELKKEKQLL